MGTSSIKYIGFYDIENSISNRVSNLAAINKMNYITEAAHKAGYKVNIISPSWMGKESEIKFEKQRKINLNEYTEVTIIPSWKTSTKITNYIKILFSLTWLFIYLLLYTKKNEKILVYHVPWISFPIRMAKFFKGFKIILEVEEIYSEVWKESKKFQKAEWKIINDANAFICVSDILEKRINFSNKPSIILYGSYKVINKRIKKKDEKKPINLVYAGSIDSTKGGAKNAIEAMRLLPNEYKLHIIGHGSKAAIKKLEEQINSLNYFRGKGSCLFSGTLHGKEYSDFLYKCDIALNPQNQGEYMNTAFPSKILSYLAHNLQVVSTEVESIKQSLISNYIVFAKDDKSESIANTILQVKIDGNWNSINMIEELNKQFINDLKEMLAFENE